MKSRLSLVLAGSALIVVALAGCSSTSATSGTSAGSGSSSGSKAAASGSSAPSGKDVATATSSLGTILVDGKGFTAYFYDHDTAGSGKSSCTGACASAWPAITASSATPTMSGVTGTVATNPVAGGKFQVTINGMPIYTYSGDTAAGQTSGQGIGGIWWVVDATGKEIKSSAKGSNY
jgi:predicted lipoprotein with Yx(FWY)xxD motif